VSARQNVAALALACRKVVPVAQVERCAGCGVLVLRGWPKQHACVARRDGDRS